MTHTKKKKKVKYPVGRFVSWNAFRDGGGCRGLIEVGAVIIEQQLVPQSIQLWTRQTPFIICNFDKSL